jgi:hypothetical protein
MTIIVHSLSPKCYWASRPSQKTFDGESIVRFTPIPNYVSTSIHMPIIPIPLSLLRSVPLSFLSLSTFFPRHLANPLKASIVFIIQSFFLQPHIPYLTCGHLFSARGFNMAPNFMHYS